MIAEPRRATDLALFDFDHTITDADSFGRFIRDLATPQQLASAKWTAGPWLAGYRLGLVSAQRLRERVLKLAFHGRGEAEIRERGARHAKEVLPGLLRPEMMQRIAWHRERGDTVVLVSASLNVYLQPWCERRGLELICNRLEVQDGVLTGRYRDGDCGPHKARLIPRATMSTLIRKSTPTATAVRTWTCWRWPSNAGTAVASSPETPSLPTPRAIHGHDAIDA